MEERGEVCEQQERAKSRARRERRPNNEGSEAQALRGEEEETRAGRASSPWGPTAAAMAPRSWRAGRKSPGASTLRRHRPWASRHWAAPTRLSKQPGSNSATSKMPPRTIWMLPRWAIHIHSFESQLLLWHFCRSFSKWHGLLEYYPSHPSPSFIMWIRVYSEVGVYWHFFTSSVLWFREGARYVGIKSLECTKWGLCNESGCGILKMVQFEILHWIWVYS